MNAFPRQRKQEVGEALRGAKETAVLNGHKWPLAFPCLVSEMLE